MILGSKNKTIMKALFVPFMLIISSCHDVSKVIMPGDNFGEQIEASVYFENSKLYISIPGATAGFIDYILLEKIGLDLTPTPIWMGVRDKGGHSNIVVFPIVYGESIDGVIWRKRPDEIAPAVYRVEGEVRICRDNFNCKDYSSTIFENFRVDSDMSVRRLNKDYK